MKHRPLTLYTLFLISAFLSLLSSHAYADDAEEKTYSAYHFGFLSPTGVDFVGKETKSQIIGGLYNYYSFGFPSLVSVGLSYYANYHANGLAVTAGLGIGALGYSSVSYRWRLDKQKYFELGIGYAQFFEGEGYYPVVSYETRLK